MLSFKPIYAPVGFEEGCIGSRVLQWLIIGSPFVYLFIICQNNSVAERVITLSVVLSRNLHFRTR